MRRALISGALALTVLAGTASAAAPVVLPQDIQGGSPSGLTALEDGGWLLTDTFNKVVWQITAEGETVKLAGQIGVAGLDGAPIGRYEDGTLDTAFFLEPWDVVPVLEGYAVSDTAAHVVRYVDEEGVRTLVGSGKSGDRNGVGTRASFSRPTGLAVDEEGRLYIADTDNGKIRRMDSKGRVTTVVSDLSEPTGLCWWEGSLYIAETGAHRIRVLTDGELTTLAGDQPGDTDGLLERARLNAPQDVAVTPDGVVYIADTGNGSVRRLANGRMTTPLDMGALDYAPVLPRSLLVREDSLLVTDPFASAVLELELREAVSFPDVTEDQWYYEGVSAAGDLGLINGLEDGSFAPRRAMTRAQFVTMLGNLMTTLDGGVVIDGESVFTDVPEELWCSGAVNWAAANHIAGGTGPEAFSPNKPLTRQQMVTFLWRFAQLEGADVSGQGDLTAFADADQVAPYAAQAMSWAVETGLIQGSSGLLTPEGQANRAQGAQVLVRFMDWLQA